MKEKRINLKLSPRNTAHRMAISKLEHYDKTVFASQTDYIVRAIMSFEEPVEITQSGLRTLIREELARAGGGTRQAAAGEDRAAPMQGKETAILREFPPTPEEEEEEEEETDLDPSTMAFMQELGI